jgi:subtilisin family serine protease
MHIFSLCPRATLTRWFYPISFLVLIAALPAAGAPPDRQTPDPIIVFTRALPLHRAGASAAELLRKAERRGRVRVIVGLDLALAFDDDLSPGAQRRQAQTLLALQDAVLRRAFGRSEGADIVKFDFIPYLSVFADAARLARLLDDPRVVNVAEDVPLHPLAGAAAARLNDYAIRLTEADKLWPIGFTGAGQTVAVLDTGIEPTHPMLNGRLVAEACYSTTSVPDYSSFCPGGVASSTKKGAAIYCPLTIANCTEGTHTSSVAVGSSSRLSGFAPGGKLIAIQIASRGNDVNACGQAAPPCVSATVTDLVEGLQHVFALHKKFSIAAASVSLGGGHFSTACNKLEPAATAAIKALENAGIATVAAVGDDGKADKIDFPACIGKAVAVAGSDDQDSISTFSNVSRQVKLFAPATAVAGAVPHGKYAALSGTAEAAAGAAGALAVVKGISPMSLQLLVASLACGGQPILAVPPATRPRLDLLRAYHYLEQPPTATARWGFLPNAAEEWTQTIGSWGANGGDYALQSPFPRTGALDGSWFPDCVGATTVTATMTKTLKLVVGFGGAASPHGLILHGSFDQRGGRASGYFFGVMAEKNRGAKTAVGVAVIYRLDDIALVDGLGAGKILCDDDPLGKTGFANYAPDGANTLIATIDSKGDLSFTVNGSEVCRAHDRKYRSGSTMIATNFDKARAFSVSSLTIEAPGFKPPPATAADRTILPVTDPDPAPRGD